MSTPEVRQGASLYDRVFGLSVNVLGAPFTEVRDRYLLHKKELGQGRFGRIRMCEHRVSKERAACKTISKRNFRCLADVDDLRREVHVLRMLQGHPHVVQLYEVFEDAEDVHLIMELCPGGDLFDRVKQRLFYSERNAARVLRVVTAVIQHCQQRGIVHRDLKPENILLLENDCDVTLKVIDFGIAGILEPGEIFLERIGSPFYMSPEVIDRRYGMQTDVWSAGVVLYILLCGRPPFWAPTTEGVYESIKMGRINFAFPPWPTVSAQAKDLVTRMLTVSPANRISPAGILDHPFITLHN